MKRSINSTKNVVGILSLNKRPFFLAMLFSTALLTSTVVTGSTYAHNTANTNSAFTIGVVGDHGWKKKDERGVLESKNVKDVVNNMESHGVDLILHPGDFSYSCSTSTITAWWDAWQASPNQKFGALGNHDVNRDGNCQNKYLEKYSSSTGLAQPQDSWTYSRVVNGVHFIAINTEDGSNGASPEQVEFVRKALQLGKEDPNVNWTLVMMHRQMKSSFSGSYHSAIPVLWEKYSQMFAENGVDLVLQAHMHNYERLKPSGFQRAECTNGNNFPESCGPAYMVIGTGGRGLYEFKSAGIHPETFVRDDKNHGYLNLDASEDKLVGKFYKNIEHDEPAIDSFTITKAGSIPIQNQTPTFNQTKALQFIKSMYDPNDELLKECPNCPLKWLWSDQLVGQIALKHIDPQMAQNIENTMNSYMNNPNNPIAMKNPWATFDPQYRQNYAIGGTSELKVPNTTNLMYSNYGGSPLSCAKYADVAFLQAIHLFNINQTTAAEQCYDLGRAMWDGQGMKDAGQITGEYAVYKTALGLLAEKITGLTPIGIPEKYFDRFQAPNGGVTTDLTAGQPQGSQNIETTFAVLAALNPEILKDPSDVPIPLNASEARNTTETLGPIPLNASEARNTTETLGPIPLNTP